MRNCIARRNAISPLPSGAREFSAPLPFARLARKPAPRKRALADHHLIRRRFDTRRWLQLVVRLIAAPRPDSNAQDKSGDRFRWFSEAEQSPRDRKSTRLNSSHL